MIAKSQLQTDLSCLPFANPMSGFAEGVGLGTMSCGTDEGRFPLWLWLSAERKGVG